MNYLEALLLGLIQGLTEFLPVSSSGHLEIGHVILGIHTEHNLMFAVAVHLATVLSTIVVFRRDLVTIGKDLFALKWNTSTSYVTKILISMIPVGIVGVFFKDQVEQLFTGNLILVGSMLIITSALLSFAHYSRKGDKPVTFRNSFLIGIAQAIAVLPGISRSGATIATGLLLKTNKQEVARFSFLMVLIPILGAALLDITGGDLDTWNTTDLLSLAIGFFAAFLSGLLACAWMINIIRKGKLIYFAVYCFIIGLFAIFAA